MPQTASAKKALRSSARRRDINDRWRRKLRTVLKDVRTAITDQDKAKASTALLAAQKVLDRSARRNIIAPRVVARKKSRLQRIVNQLA